MTEIVPAPAPAGHNNPPAPTAYEAVKLHIDDLFGEATNFLDGAAIRSQGEADAISRLMDDLRKAKTAADNARKAEAKPFDEAKAEIQARYNPLLKRADTAVDTCKSALAPWLQRLQAQKDAAAAEARAAAEEIARKAREAMRAAPAHDLSARDDAEAMLERAKKAGAAAARAANDRAQSHGGSRATTLRSYWTPRLTDTFLALSHYMAVNQEAVEAALLKLAEVDVRNGMRSIQGFEIVEERRVV